MLVRIAGVVPESCVDGAGIRFAVFLQGCLHNCHGCHNPHTHDPNGGYALDTNEVIEQFKANSLICGITLTGGEPLLQIPAAIELAKAAKSAVLNVWLYTGFTFEHLPPASAPLLDFVDVIVDGEFIISQRDLDLPFRGSRNQRIIDLNQSRSLKRIVLWQSI